MVFYGFRWISSREITMNLVHLPSPHRLVSRRCGCLLWLFLSRGIPPNLLMASCWVEAKDSEGLKMGFAVDESKAIINIQHQVDGKTIGQP